MDRFTLRLPADLARRFDAAAAGQGGRSRLLRRLMERAAEAPFPVPPDAPTAARAGKLTLRLDAEDLALLEAEAGRLGLSRTQWAVSLIRRRLHDLEGAVLDLEVAQLDAFRTEIEAWVQALGGAFEGDLSYWTVDR